MSKEQILKQTMDQAQERIPSNSTWFKAMDIYAEHQIRLHLERAADMAEWGVHQNDDGQEPFHHSDNIFVDKESITSLPIILE